MATPTALPPQAKSSVVGRVPNTTSDVVKTVATATLLSMVGMGTFYLIAKAMRNSGPALGAGQTSGHAQRLAYDDMRRARAGEVARREAALAPEGPGATVPVHGDVTVGGSPAPAAERTVPIHGDVVISGGSGGGGLDL